MMMMIMTALSLISCWLIEMMNNSKFITADSDKLNLFMNAIVYDWHGDGPLGMMVRTLIPRKGVRPNFNYK